MNVATFWFFEIPDIHSDQKVNFEVITIITISHILGAGSKKQFITGNISNLVLFCFRDGIIANNGFFPS